jgi:hypothetical protein
MAIISTETQQDKSYIVVLTAYNNTVSGGNIRIEITDSDDNLLLNVTIESGGYYSWAPATYGFYDIKYSFSNGNLPDADTKTVNFQVRRYIPEFTLPNITCLPLGVDAVFTPNITNTGNDPDFVPVEPIVNPNEIIYKVYYFNDKTNIWDNAEIDDTVVLVDPIVPNQISYPQDISLRPWIPNKLTMVKFVVTVRNKSTEVTKETTFPICGGWKIRRLKCGTYRVYNYTAFQISYYDNSTSNSTNNGIGIRGDVAPLSYSDLDITVDGIYEITANVNGQDLTVYIFRFCDLEECILKLQQQILADNSLCDECKMDKALYSKAIRLISIYETWKKLLDKDNIYSIQYASTDQSNMLSNIYDVKELYNEIMNLCEDCGNSQKPCGC